MSDYNSCRSRSIGQPVRISSSKQVFITQGFREKNLRKTEQDDKKKLELTKYVKVITRKWQECKIYNNK